MSLRCVLVVLALTACDSGPPQTRLLVDVRSDLFPGVETDEARVVLLAPTMDEQTTPITLDSPLDAGLRVATFEGLPREEAIRVRVELLQNGAVVLERVANVAAGGEVVGVTLVLSRDCRGVECPGAEGDPAFEACFGGACAPPECSDEQPELCPTTCETDEDCVPAADCATGSCRGGACFFLPRADICRNDEYCDPDVGCRIQPQLELCEDDPTSHRDLGEGTSESPHTLCNAEQLTSLAGATDDYGLVYRLAADISDVEVTLGADVPFEGELDGGGFQIADLRLDGPAPLGLFGVIGPEGYVHDLRISGEVSSGGSGVGLAAGRNEGILERVTVRGGATGTSTFVGLLAGMSLGSVVDCDAEILTEVSGVGSVGGLIGQSAGTIEGARVFGEGRVVSAASQTGGVVGNASGAITDAHAEVDVFGTTQVGGLAGSAGDVAQSSARGDVVSEVGSFTCADVGAFIGSSNGTIRECFATGDAITDAAVVSAFLGRGSGATIEDCYSTGDASGDESGTSSCSTFSPHAYVGGIAGWFPRGQIRRTWAGGTFTGGGSRGGIVGAAASVGGAMAFTIVDSFSRSAIPREARGPRGGIVGIVAGGGVIENVWWATTPNVSGMCGQTDALEAECMVDGSVDLEMEPERFSSDALAPLDVWDFDTVWYFDDEGLPRLQWERSAAAND